jgi:hypothetical protein
VITRPGRAVACMQVPRRETPSGAETVPTMCDSALSAITERQLVRAYTRLFLVPKGADGSRRISLARFGNYELLIVEFAQDERAPQFWMELYAHDAEFVIGSCACGDDLEQAAIAAETLIKRARKLTGESACCNKSRH